MQSKTQRAEPAARRLASLGSALTEATRQALRNVVENREGPRDARAWSAWVLGQLRDKDDGTIMVLGDHQGFTIDEEACLQDLGGQHVSVSAFPLLASHCIVLAMAALDHYDAAQAPRVRE